MLKSPMVGSSVVDVQGTFLGAAITCAEEEGVFFVAAHEAARALDGCRFDNLQTVRDAAASRWHAALGSAPAATDSERSGTARTRYDGSWRA